MTRATRNPPPRLVALRPLLDDLYARYNRAEFIDPDPLAPVLRHARPEDQELAGLIAASLAFGNVKTILGSIEKVFSLLPNPRADLLSAAPRDLDRALVPFRHRYADGAAMAALLHGARAAIGAHGSLGACFQSHVTPDDADVLPALAGFSHELRARGGLMKNYLLADASKGSANKRWLMYLRWMLRRDAVDPGPWAGRVPASMLIVPIDTHMHRFCSALRLTRRPTADLRAALEVTAAFRHICPEDPARYDFALTRLGIRKDTDGAAAFLEAARRSR